MGNHQERDDQLLSIVTKTSNSTRGMYKSHSFRVCGQLQASLCLRSLHHDRNNREKTLLTSLLREIQSCSHWNDANYSEARTVSHFHRNMMEYIVTKSGLKFDKLNVFSDSTIALSWVHSKKRLPALVMTLTQKIQLSRERIAHCQDISFYHVPTCENVADHATRGFSQEDSSHMV